MQTFTKTNAFFKRLTSTFRTTPFCYLVNNNQMVFVVCSKCQWYKAIWHKDTNPKKYPFDYDWYSCECGHQWVSDDGRPFHRTDGYPIPITSDFRNLATLLYFEENFHELNLKESAGIDSIYELRKLFGYKE